MPTSFVSFIDSSLIAVLEELRDAVRTLSESLSEQEFWKKPIEPGNSVGHLVLHLTGNLSHFVGGQLGKTGYVRDREREFTDPRPPSKTQALAGLDAAVATFKKVVADLTEEQLMAPHPEQRLGQVFKALVHLLTHFALHRGQMSYIARLVKPDKR
jgi:uncharacterized damage-inducible protein DinB